MHGELLNATGLSLARMIAMISYRSHQAYDDKFGRASKSTPSGLQYEVQDYLKYQGEKFLSRFDANTYVALTRLMDSHDVQRG
jgi:homoserine O-acetyltransferase